MRLVLSFLLLLSLVGPILAQPPAVPNKPAQQNRYHTGRVPPRNLDALRTRSVAKYARRLERLPKVTALTWDCRQLGLVPPVVDQGQCGSCWDFSGTSICTSALIKAGWGKADGSLMLSEQYTLDCGQNGGCNGDDNTTVCNWAKTTGLPTTAQYGPYQGRAGRCKSTAGMTMYKIQGWGFCTTTDTAGVANTQDVKNAMVAYGPIGAAIAADDAFMNNPAGTVFDRTTSTGIDHDIVLVGWDDSKGKNGAWILRNSWGEEWCDGGYCYIGYGVNAVGTEAIWVTAAPPVDPTPVPVPPLPPVPPAPPVPPTPVPPAPPTPTPGNPVTVTLTTDQVQSVITQSGSITISGGMTVRQLLDAIDKCRPAPAGPLADSHPPVPSAPCCPRGIAPVRRGTLTVDPLLARFQAAYNQDQGPRRAQYLAGLLATYEEGGRLAADPGHTTWISIFEPLLKDGIARGVNGKLPHLQAAIQIVGLQAVPSSAKTGAVVSPAARQAAITYFERVARNLKQLK